MFITFFHISWVTTLTKEAVYFTLHVSGLTLYPWYKYFKSLYSARKNDLCNQILRRQEEQTLSAEYSVCLCVAGAAVAPRVEFQPP